MKEGLEDVCLSNAQCGSEIYIFFNSRRKVTWLRSGRRRFSYCLNVMTLRSKCTDVLRERPADVKAAADLRWLAGGFFSYIGVRGVNMGRLSGGRHRDVGSM